MQNECPLKFLKFQYVCEGLFPRIPLSWILGKYISFAPSATRRLSFPYFSKRNIFITTTIIWNRSPLYDERLMNVEPRVRSEPMGSFLVGIHGMVPEADLLLLECSFLEFDEGEPGFGDFDTARIRFHSVDLQHSLLRIYRKEGRTEK